MSDKSDTPSEIELFRASLGGVRPLEQNRAQTQSKPKAARDSSSLAYRREQAQRSVELVVDGLSSDQHRFLDPEEQVLFALPGLQHRQIKRLQAGHFGWDAGLDLHGYSLDDARNELFEFISDALRRGCRALLVVHGKAYTEPGSPALLKSYVTDWLRQIEGVMAFSSAQPKDGGTGALYVLLKQNSSTHPDSAPSVRV